MATVEFFFDFTCPYAYLGSTQIEETCVRAGAKLVWRPFFLGAVFRGLYGGAAVPPPPAPKATHGAADLRRWASHWEVPLNYPSGHPRNSAAALRAVLASGGQEAAVVHALYRAYWVEGADIAAPQVLKDLLDGQGLDGAAVLSEASSEACRERLRAATEEAIARGVFGAPTCFVDGDFLVWGQDRLHFVEAACAGWRPEE